jgi:preprotein translocase subunit SecA
LTQDYEGILLRDKKMPEIDQDLFFVIEERHNTAELSEKGQDIVQEKYKDIYTVETLDDILASIDEEEISASEKHAKKEKMTSDFFDKNEILHNISQLIRAYSLFEKDVDYVIEDNKVVIVDQFTGRMMPGRRFSEGLHQALEAKEKVKIEEATQTYATITLQNYFRMYEKLSGMTGTAVTEEGEFIEIYNLPVRVIPTNLPITRVDHEDVIYMTKNEKYTAILNEIEYWHLQKKPVLVGTVTVESSETLSRLLQRKKIPHKVLNAKFHQQEAEIGANAGQPGTVTIATNMAGRGTDIKLGQGVITKDKTDYLGLERSISLDFPYGVPIDGLHIIGTERHESRRIDRQLRGRAGRQGDPGTSRFYLSLEDDLMRLFGSERIAPLMMKLGLKPGEVIRHAWISKTVETAQKRVEGKNFEIRKQLIKYDEVMNQQREVIYSYRRNVLKGYEVKNDILEMIDSSLKNFVHHHIGDSKYAEEWPIDTMFSWIESNLNIKVASSEFNWDRIDKELFFDTLKDLVIEAYNKREKMLGFDILREIERRSLLEVVDTEWRDHLHEMDVLKDGIHFRAYAQKDPLIEYKKESYTLFENLIYRIHEQTVKKVFNSYILTSKNIENILKNATLRKDELSALEQAALISGLAQKNGVSASGHPKGDRYTRQNSQKDKEKLQPLIAEAKVGRNEVCPCGTGKKYKKCCGTTENN